MNRYRSSFSLILPFLTLAIILTSCKKFVQVDPPATAITGNNVYQSDATAAAVLTGFYTTISNTGFATGTSSISLRCGLSADEFTLFGGTSNSNSTYVKYFTNKLTNATNLAYWEIFYNYLLKMNSVIEGVNNSNALTPAVKQQLMGEALFMRAFINFYLVNLYGDVPLVLTSNYVTNTNASRASVSLVYQQIINDLHDALSLLGTNYLDATLLNNTSARVRPTKWAALALLARADLYVGNWTGADSAASAVISNNAMFNLSPLNNAFLSTSSEAIWQLQPVQQGWNTLDGQMFVLSSSGPNGQNWPVSLGSDLVNVFELSDQRKANWVKTVTVGATTYYYPFKYKIGTSGAPVTEYLMVLRLGEQYLIRAEARARLNNLSSAITDLDKIRQRAGLPLIANTNPGISQTALLDAILKERRVELFSEWGHRWFDMKRTGTVNSIMGTPGNACVTKGGTWNPNWQWYPIPLYDLQQDLNLTQNPGY